MADSFIKRIQKFFGYTVTQDNDRSTSSTKIEPVSMSGKRVKLSSDSQRLWTWFSSQTADNSKTLSQRMDRYKDLEYMLYNDSVFSFCLDLYADETAQADDQFKLITVKAKDKKIQKEIESLLGKWKINQSYVRETAYNLVLYGDSFDSIESDGKNGILGITQLDVKDVSERLEFKYSEIKKLNQEINYTRSKAIRDYLKEIQTMDISASYRSYLIGYVLSSSEFVYPWQINHTKLNSSRSEFWPYGRPLFVNLIGPFRQLKTSKNLMAMARAASFPKEVYEVKTSDQMDAVEKWEAVNEAKTEFQNIGMTNKSKDNFSINEAIWMPQDLLSYKTMKSDIRMDDIADIQMLRDDFIMGMKVPKGYLIVDQGNWGNSGQSLLQQSKPFGRSVYSIQSAILESITNLLKLHFIMTGMFDQEFTEFEISLNYPVVEEAQDRLRMKNDSLRLANDIIKGIQDAIGTRDELPPKVIKDIFKSYSFLTPEEVDDYIEKSIKHKDKEVNEELENIIETRLSEEVISLVVNDVFKEQQIKEYTKNQRHYMFSLDYSKNTAQSGMYNFLRSFGMTSNKKLNEDDKNLKK